MLHSAPVSVGFSSFVRGRGELCVLLTLQFMLLPPINKSEPSPTQIVGKWEKEDRIHFLPGAEVGMIRVEGNMISLAPRRGLRSFLSHLPFVHPFKTKEEMDAAVFAGAK